MLMPLMRLAVAFFPISRLLPDISQRSPSFAPMTGQPTPAQQDTARKVGAALQSASRRLPVTILCLPRSLAGRIMLRRRGIPCQLHLGTRLEEAGDQRRLSAHAWLTCGAENVCGTAEAENFIEIARFP